MNDKGDKYLFDTNAIIYYFNGIIEDDGIFEIIKNSFNISIITKIEFLGWQKFMINNDLKSKAKRFIERANIYQLDEDIVSQTIKNRQQFKIKTPDAIIGATAMVYDMEIVTNNFDDFKNLGISIREVKLK